MNIFTRFWNLTDIRRLRNFLVKQVYWGFVAPVLWPLTSLAIRAYGFRKPTVQPNRGALNRIHVIMGSDYAHSNNELRRGPDLSTVVGKWLAENLEIPQVSEVQSLADSSALPKPDLIVVSNGFMGDVMTAGPRGFLDLARYLRSRRIPAWVFPPDTFWLKQSTYASAIVSVCGGAIVLSQNSTRHGLRYGLSKPTGHHFWTWPLSEVERWHSSKTWKEKQKIAYVANFHPSDRQDTMEWVASLLASAGYFAEGTGTERFLPWDDYVSCLRESRIVATETLTQSPYLLGPRFYRVRVNEHTLTHRVLEGFAVNAVVLTRTSELLDSLGFVAGVHYVAFPRTASGWGGWHLPSETTLNDIADRGHERFLALATR